MGKIKVIQDDLTLGYDQNVENTGGAILSIPSLPLSLDTNENESKYSNSNIEYTNVYSQREEKRDFTLNMYKFHRALDQKIKESDSRYKEDFLNSMDLNQQVLYDNIRASVSECSKIQKLFKFKILQKLFSHKFEEYSKNCTSCQR